MIARPTAATSHCPPGRHITLAVIVSEPEPPEPPEPRATFVRGHAERGVDARP